MWGSMPSPGIHALFYTYFMAMGMGVAELSVTVNRGGGSGCLPLYPLLSPLSRDIWSCTRVA
jgi:hypothetical protein